VRLAEVCAWHEEQARLRQVDAGKHGAEGGRGKKETLLRIRAMVTNTAAGSQPRSTVGQIAEVANVSRHKAAQAVDESFGRLNPSSQFRPVRSP